ncbi:hypothetical protein RJ640_016603 [Escallonia rubra]|uniref:TCP domain-containing protein n=1 Tax=Escallonia rubra TaxID=112253 RepID=A0AA88UDE2_9ASTE|nr:hypothetical protein RJ640_016603 [Escallonia rubra]
MAMKSTGGEIVQVQGGHILRATGRKDRHSKVFTAKGPRDRRVRLAAHTAIQFYDVQDRLGYDRPSKAVDWLINKAKNAIAKLDELPEWNPIPGEPSTALGPEPTELPPSSCGYEFQLPKQMGENPSGSFDEECIADTMKSFFPTSSGMSFQNYPNELMPRAPIQTEDLCLSLQSLQQPPHDSSHHAPTTSLFDLGSSPMTGFEMNYPRIVGWNGDGASRVGFIFNPQPMPQAQPLMLSQSPAFSSREPLQSSFSPFIRAWDDAQFSASRSQLSSEGFSGFQVPERIHCSSEELVTLSSKPSSTSPNSHH